MDDRQYNQLRAAVRRPPARRLGELSAGAERWQQVSGRRVRAPLAGVLARAARQLRQRELAAAAWEQLARRDWLPYVHVEAVESQVGGGLRIVLAVSNSTVGFELRRERQRLAREFGRLVPGARAIGIRAGQETAHDESH